MKWPMSGISAATNTIMPMANGEGIPKTVAKITTNTAAIAAIKIWLPTKAPTLAITALAKTPTRSRRLAGTNERPRSIA